MEDAKTELVNKVKAASNILVTVSRDPSVDQLASLVGLTLLLNKQGKHAAAVFSGKIPSTLEFLKPEETIEKNTDSLRDFIIALDKNKADKLRYKVEDNVVRIFITPYKTSITEDDFEFSQGDFNVDLVIAIGVHKQDDLDEAIVSHGRILHDATVASITTDANSELGTINWHAPESSSLSELVTQLAQSLGSDLIDEQIATALLTGIVAETDRFSNDKTSSETMSASAALMSAGANQQLVASKLQGGSAEIDLNEAETGIDDGGSLEIRHAEAAVDDALDDEAPNNFELPSPSVESLPSEAVEPVYPGAQMDSTGTLTPGAKMITEPPTLGGQLTANSEQEGLDSANNSFGMPKEEAPQLLSHDSPSANPATQAVPAPATDFGSQMTPPPPAWVPPAADPLNLASEIPSPPPVAPTAAPVAPVPPPAPEPPKAPEDVDPTGQTLTQIEKAVGSAHLKSIYPEDSATPTDAAELPGDLGAARDEVNKALGETSVDAPQLPIQALNSQQLGPELRPSDLSSDPTTPAQTPASTDVPSQTQPVDPNAPPPVPPPIPFQFGNPPTSQ